MSAHSLARLATTAHVEAKRTTRSGILHIAKRAAGCVLCRVCSAARDAARGGKACTEPLSIDRRCDTRDACAHAAGREIKDEFFSRPKQGERGDGAFSPVV